VLFLVPFCALLDQNGRYLIEKCVLCVAPSIQACCFVYKLNLILVGLVLFLRLTYKLRLHIQVFSEACDRLKLPLSFYCEEVLLVGNPMMEGGAQSAREVDEIAKLFNVRPAVAVGIEATCSRVASMMPHCRILHLAMHGNLDEKQSENAYVPGVLVLGAGDGTYIYTQFHCQTYNYYCEIIARGKPRIVQQAVMGVFGPQIFNACSLLECNWQC